MFFFFFYRNMYLIFFFIIQQNSTNLMSPPRLFVKLSENYSTILTVFVKYPGGSESWQLPINKKNVEMKYIF